MKNVIIGGETYADINRVKLNGVDGKECVFDDTSDATATASDMANGVTAYVNGEKVTGIVPVLTSGSLKSFSNTAIVPSYDSSNGRIMLETSYTSDSLVRSNSSIRIYSNASNFGDATAEDVVSGKTFTSTAGLKVTGTHTRSGIDTSDATATASDMEEGVTAYVNGEKITGTLPHSTQNISISSDPSASGSNVQIKAYASTGTKRIIGDGAALNALVPLSKFGDATADDVVSGKTFTSTAGLKATGTHVCSGGITPSGTIEITTNGTHDVTSYASALVNVPSTGSSGGLVAKSGSFTGNGETTYTISTGLSSISYFMMQLDGTISSTGFVIGSISTPGGKFRYIHCSSYAQYVKNFSYLSMDNTVTGGDFTYSGSSASTLTGTISWVAIGTE